MPKIVAANEPLVSIIIVNWNRRADVRLALDCLSKIHYGSIEVIVVDNGSTDGSVEEFTQRPAIELVALGRNDGPCIARNVGIKRATGRYVFFLDSDALLSKRALKVLVARMEAEPRVGLIGCRIDNYFKRRIDQWIYAQPFERRGHQTFETYSFSAAGAMARRDLLLEIGGFSEPMRIYNEEVELSLRIVRAGYRVLYDSDARVLHRPSVSGRAPSSDYWRLMLRNWLWIFLSYYPAVSAARRAMGYCAIYFLKCLLNWQPRAYVHGLWDGLFNRPKLNEGRKLSSDEIRYLDSLNRRRKVELGRG